MDPITAGMIATITTLTILAATALTLVHFAMKGTDSPHRAAVLRAVAEILRAIRRGKRGPR